MTNRTASTNHETLSDAQYDAGRIDNPLPETLDRLAQIRKDNEIIAARCRLLGVDVRFYTRNFRKVGGLMTTEERALLDDAKASLFASRMERLDQLSGLSWSSFQIANTYSSGDNCETWKNQGWAYGVAAVILSRQIVAHL